MGVNGVGGVNNSEAHHDVDCVATFFRGSMKTFLMVIRLNKCVGVDVNGRGVSDVSDNVDCVVTFFRGSMKTFLMVIRWSLKKADSDWNKSQTASLGRAHNLFIAILNLSQMKKFQNISLVQNQDVYISMSIFHQIILKEVFSL